MYAVIKTGGKQYRVSEGDTLQVEKLAGSPGDEIHFEEVLLLSLGTPQTPGAGGGETIKVGQPKVKGAKVSAQIVSQDRGEKIIVFKFRRRKNYRRKNGHRQPYTRVKITKITA